VAVPSKAVDAASGRRVKTTIGNASGLSDKIGRRWTLCLVLAIQAGLMFIGIPVTASKETAAVIIVLVAALIGANYGANLARFPSYTKDLWGLKSFGMNYGVLFTAWGVGGLVLPSPATNAHGRQRRQLQIFVRHCRSAVARGCGADIPHQTA